MTKDVKSGLLEFSDDQQVFVAVDEDDTVLKAVLRDGEGNETALGALPTDEQVQEAVDAWLDDHPEATTTVQDGAITTAKLADGSVTDDKLAADGIKAEVSDLKTDLEETQTEVNGLFKVDKGFNSYNILTWDKFETETKNNYNSEATSIAGDPALRLSELNGYNSYCFKATKEIKVACPTSGYSYYALTVLNGTRYDEWSVASGYIYKVGTASNRYRASNNNLPTPSSPLTIPEGSTVAITVKTEAPMIFLYEEVQTDIIKGESLGSNNKQIFVEMHDGYFYYYKQTKDGNFLRFKFNHFVDVDTNADGWVQRNVDLVDSEKTTVIMPVITTGEWEMAIQIKDAPDFIGCQNHGSEVSSIVNFYFDGVGKTPTDGNTFFCNEIKVNEKSTMYDPTDETTIVGTHYKIYTITVDEVKIEQKIEWVADVTLDKSYVLMCPAVRGNDSTSDTQVTDKAYDEKTFTEYNCGTTTLDDYLTGYTDKGDTFNLYGTTSKVAISTICEIKNRLAEAFTFLSNAIYYNKIYCGYNKDDYSVSNGDVWEWVSHYIINA